MYFVQRPMRRLSTSSRVFERVCLQGIQKGCANTSEKAVSLSFQHDLVETLIDG